MIVGKSLPSRIKTYLTPAGSILLQKHNLPRHNLPARLEADEVDAAAQLDMKFVMAAPFHYLPMQNQSSRMSVVRFSATVRTPAHPR
jgi:hypothetical protein